MQAVSENDKHLQNCVHFFEHCRFAYIEQCLICINKHCEGGVLDLNLGRVKLKIVRTLQCYFAIKES